MFNFFKSTIGLGSRLGVDLGTTAIKIAEISSGRGQAELNNYGILETHGHLERINSAIQTGSLKIIEKDTIELLKMLLKEGNFGTKEAVASIPSFSAFTTLLEIPQMSNVEIVKTMQYQVEQYIPLPISEVAIDWFKVGQRQDDQGFVKDQILLISIPNDLIQGYKNIFRICGLKLSSLEVETVSLARALSVDSGIPALIVDIGSRSTNIIAVEGDALKYAYQTDFASANLTQSIASGLGINTRRAEKIKNTKGLLGGEDSELSTLMEPFLDAIINEIKRVKNKYEQSFSSEIKKIILCGSGAKLMGIDKYFQKEINLPVEIGNALATIKYPSEFEPLVKEVSPTLAVAVGLALR